MEYCAPSKSKGTARAAKARHDMAKVTLPYSAMNSKSYAIKNYTLAAKDPKQLLNVRETTTNENIRETTTNGTQ